MIFIVFTLANDRRIVVTGAPIVTVTKHYRRPCRKCCGIGDLPIFKFDPEQLLRVVEITIGLKTAFRVARLMHLVRNVEDDHPLRLVIGTMTGNQLGKAFEAMQNFQKATGQSFDGLCIQRVDAMDRGSALWMLTRESKIHST